MDVRVGLWRRLSAEELMLLNCGVGEDSWESLGLQGDPTSPFWRDQPWDFFGRNNAKAETPIFWPPHGKNWLIGEDLMLGGIGGRRRRGRQRMRWLDVGWHHWLDGHESEWTPGVGGGQGGLACCNSWGCKELDTTEWLIWSESKSMPQSLMPKKLKLNGTMMTYKTLNLYNFICQLYLNKVGK